MASTSTAADFHKTYTSSRANIEALLTSNKPPPLTEISKALGSLRGELRAVLAGLPAYDQRKYELDLTELERRLGGLRAKEKPRSKFTFSKPVTSTSTSTSTSGSTSTTTIELGNTSNNSSSEPRNETKTPSLDIDLGSSSTSSQSHSLHHQKHQYLTLDPSKSEDVALTLESLEECVIDLRSTRLTALHADGLKRCVVLVGWVGGSVLLSRLEGCLIILGARQVRIHSSTTSDILLHVLSLPIIEHSSDLHFGPYPRHLLSDLDNDTQSMSSKFDQVQDFDWLRGGPSPNWTLLPNDSARVSVADLEILREEPKDIQRILQTLLPTGN